jgi:hypothetical protein
VPRFVAPPRQSRRTGGNVERSRKGGLGGAPEPLADDESDELHRLESTTPRDGFTGIESQTRFTSPAGQLVIGHGGAQSLARTQGGAPPDQDPGDGRSQFDFPFRFRAAQSELPDRAEYMASLDNISIGLVARRVIRYFRHRIDSTVPAFQTQDPNAMGWGRAPFPRAIRQPRFTLRPEFMQGAQSFTGEHTLVVKYGKSSTSPVRMIPPRTNRLTRRAAPGSFGQRATVLT